MTSMRKGRESEHRWITVEDPNNRTILCVFLVLAVALDFVGPARIGCTHSRSVERTKVIPGQSLPPSVGIEGGSEPIAPFGGT
jgi:hypothetical protein